METGWERVDSDNGRWNILRLVYFTICTPIFTVSKSEVKQSLCTSMYVLLVDIAVVNAGSTIRMDSNFPEIVIMHEAHQDYST